MKTFASACLFVAFSFLAAAQIGSAVQAHPLTVSGSGVSPGAKPSAGSTVSGLTTSGPLPATTVAPLPAFGGTRHLQHSLVIGSGSVLKVSGSTNGSQSRDTAHLAGTISETDVPASSYSATQQIEAVIDGDWSAWTGGPNNKLTITDVEILLKNPKITGSQAAVLGMIADQMYSDAGTTPNVVPSYTQAETLSYVLGTDSSPNAVFYQMGQSCYTSVMSQIASSTTATAGKYSLYGSFSGPQLSSIQQGELGDCFFLSGVDSVLNENPQLISNMITQLKSGSFEVRFATGTREIVSITDGEIAAFSQATNNGAWLAVMGMAENSVIVHEAGVPMDLRSGPLGVISDGGFPAQSLRLLTGKPYSDLGDGTLDKYSVSAIDQLLETDLANKTPINVTTSDHALSILAFNPQTQEVTILNPWGVSGQYGAAEDPGFSNQNFEVEMTNGVFEISTSTMLRNFYGLTGETSLLKTVAAPSRIDGSRIGALSINPAVAGNILLSDGAAPTGQGLFASDAAGQDASTANLLISNTSGMFPQITLGSSLLLQQDSVNTTLYAAGLATRAMALQAQPPAAAAVAPRETSVVSDSVLEAEQGSVLVRQDSPLALHTERGTVHVAPRAVVLVLQVGDEVAVSNLCDRRLGDVVVEVNGSHVTVPMGKTVLLASVSQVPDKMALADLIDGRKAFLLGTYGQTNAFIGGASYSCAFSSCPQFRELLRSRDAVQRDLAQRVLKAGAAVITLASK